MKNLSYLIFLCSALPLSSVNAQHSSKMESLDPLFAETRQSILDAMEKDDIPGLAIAVVDRERILWSEGLGVRDRVSGEPVTPETVFSIQSISKTFTATAVMLAVQDELVDLDAPITDYLPDFTVNSRFEENPERKMTLRHLLSHTAGFTHEAPVGNNFNAASPSFNAHVASVSDTWLRFPVGERFAYSNLGIDLAGFIIQEASGIPFETYVKERLLEPLGMHASFVDTPEWNGACPDCARGHNKHVIRFPDYIPLTASGGVRVSAVDGARFVRFHLNQGSGPDGQLLGQSFLTEMYRPAVLWRPGNSEFYHGMGVYSSLGEGTYSLKHGGGGFGFNSMFEWFSEYGIGYVLLINTVDHSGDVFKVVENLLKKIVNDGIVEKVLGDNSLSKQEMFADASRLREEGERERRKVEKVPPSGTAWEDYLGGYHFVYGGFELRDTEGENRPVNLRLTTKDGYLFVALGGSEPQPLEEHLPGLFFCQASGEALDFRSDPPTWRNIELERIGKEDRLRHPTSEADVERFMDDVWYGDLAGIRKGLAQGVPIESQGLLGLTAAQVARWRGLPEVMKLLQQHGASLDEPLPPPDELVERLILSKLPEEGPGAAVLVGQHGNILFEGAFGFANVEEERLIGPETRFRIASITKPFTAAAILKLQEKGKLDVEDKLAKYLPEFPRADEVTLHHLLTHTSGIRSFTTKPDYPKRWASPISLEDLVEYISEDPYDFDPGSRWLYSNSGYAVLAYVVERVSSRRHSDFLREEFFDPLGMRNTGVQDLDEGVEDEADGYHFRDDSFFPIAEGHGSWGVGEGSMYSTTKDLFLWNEAVFSGLILNDDSLNAAFTPAATSGKETSEPSSEGYGFGWVISNFRGQRVIAHSGGLNGFVTHLMRVPAENLTVVVLVNIRGHVQADAVSIAHAITEIYLADILEPREAIEGPDLTAEELDAFVGLYDIGLATLIVTQDKGRLFIQVGGPPRVELMPKSGSLFLVRSDDWGAEIEFERDEVGLVNQASFRMGGLELSGPRVP